VLLQFDAARYFQHAGLRCPVCGLEGVWQNYLNFRTHIVNNVRVILVPCHCTRCRGSYWVETYRLVGADWDAQTAIATAEKTYR
jgi:hypothetical protein